jgi:acyl-CoA reductase-like NAD-dependent aldehyde dehydrogenase
METYKIYAAGNFLETENILQIRNPYTGEVFANTFLANEKIVEFCIVSAVAAKKAMAALPSWKKSEILNQIASSLKAERSLHAELLSKESAKPLMYALGEIDRAVQIFLIAAEECKRIPDEYLRLDWTRNGEGKEGLIKYFPVGVVAGISPFNFPLNLAVHKIAPAIAAGCPIILKPASSTPLSTLLLAQLIDKTELPKGAISILPLNRSTGNILVTDERISMISFTGSPEVGWEMKKNSGKKKVVLELGGNAGVIISENVKSWDTEKKNSMAKKCVLGAFAYSGQICIHAQRYYIHEEIYEEFIRMFIDEMKNIKSGDPIHPDTNFSCMIDETNAIRVEGWIKEAVVSGAKIIFGGKREASFLEPTILTGTNAWMKVNREEAFGPVICVEKYKTLEEAIRLVNESRFGLQCGVFTDSIDEMNKCFNEIEVGGVILNDVPTLRFDHMPYGGIKDSGLGREGVRYAMMDMMESRVLVK